MHPTFIRRYLPSDRDAVLALKDRRGPDFPFCDPDNSGPCTQPYVAVKDGKVVALGFGHIIVEAFLCIDPALDVVERLGIIRELVKLGVGEAKAAGFQEMQALVPPSLPRYPARLEEIGFEKTGKTHMVIGTMEGEGLR